MGFCFGWKIVISTGKPYQHKTFFKGKGGVNASLMSFGGTGSHKYVVVIE